MSTPDDLTGTLTRELTEHAHEMDGTQLHLADVTGRARSIRRRRTATAVAGVAAAVAVIIPTAALATHTGGKAEPAPTVTLTPSPTETANGDGHQPAPGVLDVSDLPTGAPPRMDYVKDGTLQFANGEGGYQLRTRYTPQGFVSLNDGARVWQTVDGSSTPYVEIQDADGGFHDPVRSDWGLTVNPSHTVVAWLDPSGQVVIWEGRATDPRPLGDPVPGSDLRLGPVYGQGIGAGGGSGPGCSDGSCTVYVNAPGDPGKVWEVSDAGTQQLRDGGFLKLSDLSEGGLWIGLTDITDFSTCSKLLGAGEFQGFATCKNQLSSFSPDARRILALPSYFDGLGPSSIGMYDLEGNRLFERSATRQVQSYYTGATWEDDSHLLAPVYQDGKWALVRIASDGTMEYAVAPEPGNQERSPYILPTGGRF